MVYQRFVEFGRVALVNNGDFSGKLVVIADVIDQTRALCENPVNGVPRQMMRFQDLNLTDLKINIPHGARGGAIRKQYVKEEIDAKWEKTSWAKKLKARTAKRNLNDFGRFKAKVEKQRRNRKIKAIVKSLKKK
ncbi:60S ribosomal protein L14-like [Hydractinia symbiolongicarpus]|uniref:60S ribosomal protein L14-like n=1 Tax=Hydractinia symbiolongicarpus TaxID=13093 RepID=UPI00254B7722|nr:60S ribosomal protein L14-like [Hydractinia symbiolongicarpus]